jgi:hypothetical protein
MNTQTQIAEYQKEIVRITNGIDYCNGCILNSQTKDWERKEYKAVIVDYKAEIVELNSLIERINRLYPNG